MNSELLNIVKVGEYEVYLVHTEEVKWNSIMKCVKLHEEIKQNFVLNQLVRNLSMTENNDYWKAQHIFIVSKDDINKGDWMLDINNKCDTGVNQYNGQDTIKKDHGNTGIDVRKVLASSNRLIPVTLLTEQFLNVFIDDFNNKLK